MDVFIDFIDFSLTIQSFDSGRRDCETFLNYEKCVSELQEKISFLNAELQEKEALIESERSAHKAQLRDFITAVKVAERCREEAQLELTQWAPLLSFILFVIMIKLVI
ncbi:unnamed protein product [Cylicostephanus goldi]|uniref:Uncharacterized protein n=1 Tax=Cylicostephanus goldi TaxID=71465 RepID=A0A3P6V3K5_CYLGO|nr:unnamed protein product [Cylicostephanus goldi]